MALRGCDYESGGWGLEFWGVSLARLGEHGSVVRFRGESMRHSNEGVANLGQHGGRDEDGEASRRGAEPRVVRGIRKEGVDGEECLRCSNLASDVGRNASKHAEATPGKDTDTVDAISECFHK